MILSFRALARNLSHLPESPKELHNVSEGFLPSVEMTNLLPWSMFVFDPFGKETLPKVSVSVFRAHA